MYRIFLMVYFATLELLLRLYLLFLIHLLFFWELLVVQMLILYLLVHLLEFLHMLFLMFYFHIHPSIWCFFIINILDVHSFLLVTLLQKLVRIYLSLLLVHLTLFLVDIFLILFVLVRHFVDLFVFFYPCIIPPFLLLYFVY